MRPSATHSTGSGFVLTHIPMQNWFIYILLCDKKTYYVGLTSNLENRFKSHKAKHNLATKKFSSVELVYSEQFQTRKLAEKRERQLKGWTFAKKKALIDGNKDLLTKLSKTRSVSKSEGIKQ